MKLSVLTREFERVIKQRNMLFPVVVLMGISQVLLILMVFWKDEKTILVPPVLERPFSVDGSAYSASYFEQMGLFISNLILTKSSSTSASQNTLLYKYIDPEMIGSFKRDLLDEEEFLKKDNSGYVFYPKETLVNLGSKSVLIKGERHSYIGSQRVDISNEAYRLTFVLRGNILLLQNLQKEKSND